jgi:site-specific recombinase
MHIVKSPKVKLCAKSKKYVSLVFKVGLAWVKLTIHMYGIVAHKEWISEEIAAFHRFTARIVSHPPGFTVIVNVNLWLSETGGGYADQCQSAENPGR